MVHRMAKLAVAVTVLSVVVTFSAVPALAAGSAASPKYTNHTVGGSAGWFFDDSTNSSVTDYSAWAASESFYLGDFLIFETNTNMTVVQTYNKTTYGLCSADEDYGNGTSVYKSLRHGGLGLPMVAEVPLDVAGPNYYFCDAGDYQVHCLQGMRFQITVLQRQVLPPALSQPPPPSDAGPSPKTKNPPPALSQPPPPSDAGPSPKTKNPPTVVTPSVSSPGLAFGTSMAGGGAAMGAWRLLVVAVVGAVGFV